MTSTLQALEGMHKEVSEKASLSRQRTIDRHNARVGVRPCDFRTGEFVLRGVFPRRQHPKLALRWIGPYRIIQVLSDFVYVLQHVVSGDKHETHGSRIQFFRNSDFEVTKEVREHVEYQSGELQ